MRNPWLLLQVNDLLEGKSPRQPSTGEVCCWYEQLLQDYSDFFEGTERAVLARMKEMIGYMHTLFEDGVEWKKHTLRLQSLEDFRTALFKKLEEGRFRFTELE